MEPGPELQDLLAKLEAEGSEAGTGDFTLDPRRALELLHEQGSVSSNAPLFLFRAIYEHTRGATIRWKRGMLDSSLSWPESFGPLPDSPYKYLAQGAFEAASIKLQFGPGKVLLRSSNVFTLSLNEPFQETFQAAEERLGHYPVEGLYERESRPEPWRSLDFNEGHLEFRVQGSERHAIHWVVCGIEFLEKCPFSLDVTIKDDHLACDLTLTKLRLSQRKKRWLNLVNDSLQSVLEELLFGQEQIFLDKKTLDPDLEKALSFLPYIVSLPPDNRLRHKALQSILFRDVFETYWSLERLLRAQEKHESLYVVPSVPKDCPAEAAGERPVLLWEGDGKKFGETLFRKVQSGAGYLYSLNRNQSISALRTQDEEQFLATVEWERGTLGLKALGPPESRCEVKLVGKRRGSETLFLESPAPPRLSLVWRSRDEVASWDEGPDFYAEFRRQVVNLVERGYGELQPDPEWLWSLLDWASEENELGDLKILRAVAFLPTVDGAMVSPETLRANFPLDKPIPVLEERSASLPDSLPFPQILWYHPLLERLGFKTEEVSSAVRKAYWKEEGRKKWLLRYAPQNVQDWPDLADAQFQDLPGGHLLVKTTEPSQAPRLVIWREGRPLGFRALSKDDFSAGYWLVYCDDEFPADQYWSGPEQSAVEDLKPWMEQVRRQTTSCQADS